MFILWGESLGESCGNQSHLCHGSVVAALHACAVRAVRPLTAPGAVACPQWPGAFWLGVVRPGESRVDLHWISQAVWKEITALLISFVKRAKNIHVFNRKMKLVWFIECLTSEFLNPVSAYLVWPRMHTHADTLALLRIVFIVSFVFWLPVYVGSFYIQ